MKKKMDNLLIDFDIANIQDYMTNEAWKALQQLGKEDYTWTILSSTQNYSKY